MSERRYEPRVPVCFDATIEGSGSRFGARVTDLSETGCYLDTQIQAGEGDIVTFTVRLPGNDSLSLAARVAHHTPRLGFGVRFVDLDEDQIRKIRSIVGPESSVSGRFDDT